MHLSALLDLDLVAVEAEDRVSVLLELAAPVRSRAERRPPATLEVVLDRSGSMGDGRLAAAAEGLRTLVDRLEPTDNFGLVVFDDTVGIAVPAGRSPTGRPSSGRSPRSCPAG